MNAVSSIAPVISFHDYILLDVYRQGLEHVSHIGLLPTVSKPVIIVPPVIINKSKPEEPEEEMHGSMLDEMEVEAWANYDKSHWVVDKAIEEKQDKHIVWLEQQQKEQQQLIQCKQELYSKEYALIQQLENRANEPMLYDYTTEDIIEGASAHCSWLLDNDIHVDKMNNTNALLRRNLEFELLCQDKRSAKIVSLHDCFVELALREDVDEKELASLIAQTYKISKDPETDQLLKKCLEQKKRGRTSEADRKKTPNIVDALKKESISPRKPILPLNENTTGKQEIVLTDKYKVFLSLLSLVHHNAQTNDNYGAYLEKINKLVDMDSTKIDWPMQSLMKSIKNMEACLGIKEIENIDIMDDEVYYCSYSGDRIKHGDSVYHIRILEYSHERHKKWRIIKNRPNREFEAPEFMESIKAFFIKKDFISLTGLWYRDFDDSYKAQHASFFNTEIRPQKKQRSVSQPKPRIIIKKDGHLWQRMNYMRNYIDQHNLEHKEVRGKTFSDERQRIHTILDEINDSHSLQVGLCDIIGAYCNEEDNDTKMAYINRLMYVLLNFIDIFYTVSSCEDGTHRPLTSRDTEICALRLLLDVSYQRRNHPSYNVLGNEFEKIDKGATDVNQYDEFRENNFLFLSVFDYFFPTTVIKKESEAIEVLHMFGL